MLQFIQPKSEKARQNLVSEIDRKSKSLDRSRHAAATERDQVMAKMKSLEGQLSILKERISKIKEEKSSLEKQKADLLALSFAQKPAQETVFDIVRKKFPKETEGLTDSEIEAAGWLTVE